jgi:hypothetical protein
MGWEEDDQIQGLKIVIIKGKYELLPLTFSLAL